ncbi:MAG: hypothetical protein K2W88_07965 [Pararheinheimera sp.]|nr:hypothetical protein [Rheinheimera sp.]
MSVQKFKLSGRHVTSAVSKAPAGLDLATLGRFFGGSVTMKSSIGAVIAIFLIALSVWLADIANDQSKTVKVESVVSAYNAWECGGQQTIDCKVVFETEANQSYDVKRIRYGKDFMAIQIKRAGASGWIFSGNEVQVSAAPNT